MKLNPQNKKDNFFELNWMECGLNAKTHPTRQYAFIKCAYVFVLLISLLHDCLLLMYVLCTNSYNIKMATTTTTKHRFALCYCYYNFFSAHLISCVCGFFFLLTASKIRSKWEFMFRWKTHIHCYFISHILNWLVFHYKSLVLTTQSCILCVFFISFILLNC